MISVGENDPDFPEMFGRDDSQRGKLILIHRKCLGGMIFVGEIDPDLQEMSGRDDSQRGD